MLALNERLGYARGARRPQPRRDPVSDFRIDLRVRFAETDAMGVAHHAAYLPYLETARVEYLRALGHPYRELRDRDGLEFAVVGVDLRYHAPLRFDDAFTVTCALAERGARDLQPRLPRRARHDARAQRAHAPRRARPRDGRAAAPAGVAGGPAGRGRLGCGRPRIPTDRSRSMRRLLASSPSPPPRSSSPPPPSPRPSPCPSRSTGTLFNNKPNVKLTIKLGGSLRFVWKNGFHNVLTQKAPAGAKKVNSGDSDRDAQADRSSSPRRRASTSSTACPTRRSAWCSR